MGFQWYDWVPVVVEIVGLPLHLLVLYAVVFSRRRDQFCSPFYSIYKSSGERPREGNTGRAERAAHLSPRRRLPSPDDRPRTARPVDLAEQSLLHGDHLAAAVPLL